MSAVRDFDSRIEPHAISAEAAVLGGILMDNGLIDEAAEMLRPRDFFLQSNRMVFVAMLALHRQNQSIDEVTLTEFLKARREYEKVGGIAKLAEYISGVPRMDSIAYYARIIRQKSQVRMIMQAAQSIKEMCATDPDNPTLASDVQQMIFNACDTIQDSGFVHIADAAAEYMANIEAIRRGEESGDSILTGFDDLDDHTLGLVRGDLIVLAGRPSNGKTSLATHVALNIARHNVDVGRTVAFFSLEMSTRQISEKTISNLAQVDSMKMRAGCLNDDEWERAMNCLVELAHSGLHVCDASRLTTSEIKAKAMRLKRDKGLDLIIVDHLSEMGGDKKQVRRERIGDASRELKAIAKTLNVPVLALSQLNRQVEGRSDNEPHMSDLADSGDVEQAADVIMFIYNEADKVAGSVATIKIGKSRNGKTGYAKLAYRKEMNWLGSFSDRY
jgi:replicative DNA helicase